MRKNVMTIGQPWNTTGTYTNVSIYGPDSETMFIDSRILLGLETITVNQTEYQDCLKFELNYSYADMQNPNGGRSHRTQWHCPGIGLVKAVSINHAVNSGVEPTVRWAIRELESAVQ